MFCTKCGTQLNDDDLFCFRCGTRVAQEKHDVNFTIPTELPPQEDTTQQEIVEYTPSESNQTNKQEQTQEQHQSTTTSYSPKLIESTLLKIISIFLIVVGSLGISIYSLSAIHSMISELREVLAFLNFLEHSITLRGFFTVVSFISKVMLSFYFVYSIIAGIRGCKQESVKKCNSTATMLLIITAINILLTGINDYHYYSLHDFMTKIAMNLVYIYPLQIALPFLYKIGTNKFKNLNPTQTGD